MLSHVCGTGLASFSHTARYHPYSQQLSCWWHGMHLFCPMGPAFSPISQIVGGHRICCSWSTVTHWALRLVPRAKTWVTSIYHGFALRSLTIWMKIWPYVAHMNMYGRLWPPCFYQESQAILHLPMIHFHFGSSGKKLLRKTTCCSSCQHRLYSMNGRVAKHCRSLHHIAFPRPCILYATDPYPCVCNKLPSICPLCVVCSACVCSYASVTYAPVGGGCVDISGLHWCSGIRQIFLHTFHTSVEWSRNPSVTGGASVDL